MNSKKTRKALIGTFIGMMALTAASAATAGVAWFTTTRTATVHFPNASVTSNRGELLVGKFNANGTSKNYTLEQGTNEFVAETDSLSSLDGYNFYDAMLDVDGTELGIYDKVANPKVASFGFSASTQSKASTDLTVYLEEMEVTVTNAPILSQTFDGDGATAEFTLTKEPDTSVETGMPVEVYVDGVKKTLTDDYTVDATNKKVTFKDTAIPAAGAENVEIIYKTVRETVGNEDPIKNSIRVALFGAPKGASDTMESVAVEANRTLVWDTTHATSPVEVHQGIEKKADEESVSETLYIRAANAAYVDLHDVPNSIDTITLNGASLDSGEYTITPDSRRVAISKEVKRGDAVAVTYKTNKAIKSALENDPTENKIDGYYAGTNLKDTEADGDLTSYGAYLGEIQSNTAGDATPLNIVVKAWIEGTDADHKEIGELFVNGKHSIDVSDDDYQFSMDLKLVAIDSNIA